MDDNKIYLGNHRYIDKELMKKAVDDFNNYLMKIKETDKSHPSEDNKDEKCD